MTWFWGFKSQVRVRVGVKAVSCVVDLMFLLVIGCRLSQLPSV